MYMIRSKFYFTDCQASKPIIFYMPNGQLSAHAASERFSLLSDGRFKIYDFQFTSHTEPFTAVTQVNLRQLARTVSKQLEEFVRSSSYGCY